MLGFVIAFGFHHPAPDCEYSGTILFWLVLSYRLGVFSMFSGDLYDIRSLSFDLLLACVSMLFRLALFMVCFSFFLNWVFFIFIIVSCCRLYLVSIFFIWVFHGVFGLVAMSVVWHLLMLWILW